MGTRPVGLFGSKSTPVQVSHSAFANNSERVTYCSGSVIFVVFIHSVI